MPVIGIDHVQLAMPPGEEDRARGFYRDVLGLREVPKPAELAGRGGCWFESAGAKIHVGVEREFRAATKAHPGLLVTGLETIVERCRNAGYRVVDGEPSGGFVRVFVADPFGNRIELLQASCD